MFSRVCRQQLHLAQRHLSSRTKVDFDSAEAAYAHLSASELLRSYTVLSLCAFKPLVRHADDLLKWSKKVLGSKVTMQLVKHSFFAHFCAGETIGGAQPMVERLRASNVNAIMDYAAEADVADDGVEALKDQIKHRKTGVIAARTYEYAGEEECDANCKLIEESINGAATLTGDQFVAMKLTAIAKPELLEKMSAVLLAIKELWVREFGASVAASAINRERFGAFTAAIGVNMSSEDCDELFEQLDLDRDGSVDYIEWTRLLSVFSLRGRQFFVQAGYDLGFMEALARNNSFAKVLPLLDEPETVLLDSFMDRLNRICALAESKDVRLMIDAEQTYMQPAIDHFARDMQQRYNLARPIIFNTYQAYLKSSYDHLEADLERSRRLGFQFAGKLVRGAYMVGERKRAADLGLPSPIHDTLDDTHVSYDRCIDLALGHRASLVVATHNRNSIEHCVQTMQKNDIDANDNVYFGQLLGMADFLSFPLAKAGYQVYKYVPYGPVDTVIPYLVRRAQENGDMLSNAAYERRLMLQALRNKFARREEKHEKKTQ